jgi:cell division protein FtsW (lipid II flippase)
LFVGAGCKNAMIWVFGKKTTRMDEKTANPNPFNWRPPSFAALLAFVVFFSIAICQADTGLFLYLFLAGPILAAISITLLAYTAIGKGRSKRRTLLPALAAFWVVSTIFFVFDIKHPSAIRTRTRWLLWSHNYEDRVLAQSASANGEFKHVEWDGWGWGGEDTTEFLVFDPTDSLSAAARSQQPGKFDGIPCQVPRVSRLESHWYTVVFYTNQSWGECR